uniref:DUF8039 domain-containing protein n=1 Tax=Setaria viridis TaxID=4556 RepID=A0A4U6VEN3_SETVI|nr:hypothetical protein SEVIR_4G235100v2 [Setaria viridis]
MARLEDEQARLDEEYLMELIAQGRTDDPPNEEVNRSQTDIYLNMSPSESSSRPKRKRGKKKLEGRIIITEIVEDGEPIAPHNAKTKLVNQIGFLVRDKIPISFQNWKILEIDESIASTSMVPINMVPEREKEMIWEQIKENFTFESVDEAKVKDWSFQKDAIAFQTYKKNLNEDYIKKGLHQISRSTRRGNFNISPSQHQSSITSTEAPAGGSSDIFEDNQHHTMDDITRRAPCELVTPVKNKLIVVAYGVAKQPTQGQTIHVVDISVRSYTKVGVDRMVDGWDDLELEIPGGDGEKNLRETIHGWILWLKRYITITQPNPPTLRSPPQGSRARSPTPSARAPSPLSDRNPSMSPPVDRDSNMTPPPPNKPKEKQPELEKPYDMTDAELKVVVGAEVKAHFAPKPPMKKDPPLDKKKKKSGSSIPHLGTQSNQSIAPLRVLSEFDKNLLQGEDHLGKPLVWPQLVDRVPTKMYKLHQWYMEASANGLLILEVRIGDQHYFRGDDIINVPLEELYFLYNQDALDKSLISSWIQTCRRKGYYDIGFMDPDIINESTIRDRPNQTLKNIYKFLDNQHYKKYILLPYNFNFHWIFLVIAIDRSAARFCRHLAGEFKEELDFKPEFPCLRQNPGNNLSGYYVCEFIHYFVGPKRITDHEFRLHMKEALLETEKIRAIQEQLSGFLLDEVVNPAGEFHNGESNLHHQFETFAVNYNS